MKSDKIKVTTDNEKALKYKKQKIKKPKKKKKKKKKKNRMHFLQLFLIHNALALMYAILCYDSKCFRFTYGYMHSITQQNRASLYFTVLHAV